MAMPSITRDDLKAALPDVTSPVSVKGLNAPIDIFRDAYGIPHVRATTLHDAFFGQGFASAQDRLWHMEYDRKRAEGRWAEFAGQAAVEGDVLARRMRLAATSRVDYQHAGAEAKGMLDAYAAGVNAFLQTSKALPVEYRIVGAKPELWEPWHSLAVFKVRHGGMGVFEMKIWAAQLIKRLGPERAAKLMPGYEPGGLMIVPPGSRFHGPDYNPTDDFRSLASAVSQLSAFDGSDGGSNNWAVHGTRTASGKPIVAGDPHRGLDTPNCYYLAHVACPEFDVAGISFPGVPGFPHFGHNKHVAWCVTHAMADYQDLYIEKFKEGDPAQYEFKGEWRKAEVYHEVMKVRGLPDISFDVTETHHGPIVMGDPASGYAIAFRYTATAEPCTFQECLIPQLKASNADEVEEAMRQWVDPCNNYTFADIHGNIGYRTRGKVPIRHKANGWLPVPGWTGEHEWQGFIPFEEMPRMRNPQNGFLVTANNRIVSKDYKYYLGNDYAPEFRARRIYDRLLAIEKARVEDIASVHAEATSIPAQHFRALVSRLKPASAEAKEAVTRLSSWDCVMSPDAVGPTIYTAFRDALTRRVLEPLLGPLARAAFQEAGRGGPRFMAQVRSRLHTMVEQNDRTLLPPGTDWETLMTESLTAAVDYLGRELGPNMEGWKWGVLHHTQHKHTLSATFPSLARLLDPPQAPHGGDGETPRNGSYHIDQPFIVSAASAARYIFDFGDWDNSRWIIPLGESGHPGSPHYADMLPLWSKVQVVPMLFDWKRIESEAKTKQAVSPKGK